MYHYSDQNFELSRIVKLFHGKKFSKSIGTLIFLILFEMKVQQVYFQVNTVTNL